MTVFWAWIPTWLSRWPVCSRIMEQVSYWGSRYCSKAVLSWSQTQSQTLFPKTWVFASLWRAVCFWERISWVGRLHSLVTSALQISVQECRLECCDFSVWRAVGSFLYFCIFCCSLQQRRVSPFRVFPVLAAYFASASLAEEVEGWEASLETRCFSFAMISWFYLRDCSQTISDHLSSSFSEQRTLSLIS